MTENTEKIINSSNNKSLLFNNAYDYDSNLYKLYHNICNEIIKIDEKRYFQYIKLSLNNVNTLHKLLKLENIKKFNNNDIKFKLASCFVGTNTTFPEIVLIKKKRNVKAEDYTEYNEMCASIDENQTDVYISLEDAKLIKSELENKYPSLHVVKLFQDLDEKHELQQQQEKNNIFNFNTNFYISILLIIILATTLAPHLSYLDQQINSSILFN